jgi:two-component system, sensor histidine kinase and response regulator
VALSASILDSDREQTLAAGMNDHLGKPILERELYRIVEKWLPARETPAGAEAFDVQRGLGFARGDREFYAKSLRTFRDRLAEALAEAESADGEALRRGARQLKGQAEMLGATRVAAAEAALEASPAVDAEASARWRAALREAKEVVDGLERGALPGAWVALAGAFGGGKP